MSLTPIKSVAGLLLIAAVLATSTGCGTQQQNRSAWYEPYRFDIPQGNYLTQQMLDQIKSGMSREQVRAALGAPLLNQMFRQDRWDYVFSYLHASGKRQQRNVTIYFKNNRVDRIEADELPARDDSADEILPGLRGSTTNSKGAGK